MNIRLYANPGFAKKNPRNHPGPDRKIFASGDFAKLEDPSLRFGMTETGFTAKFDEMGY